MARCLCLPETLLGMSLSFSYQFPHGSVIKFCQFPCSAVFVVGEMTCTLGGKDETVLYIIRCFTLQTATGNEIWTKTRLGTVIWYPHPSPALLILSTFFYNEPGLRTKDSFLNLAQLFLVFKGWSAWALRTAKNASCFNKDNKGFFNS